MRVILSFCALLFACSISFAEADFPAKSIRLILPYGAGGTDLQYRKLAELAGAELGQPVVVENKPGGGGTAAVVHMAKTAKPDGYTIGASTGPLLRQPHMQKVAYDPLKDFTWIIGLGDFTFVITVAPDSPFNSLDQLVRWAKENPGKLTYGSPGFASSQYMAMAELSRVAGIETTHVPFKGGVEISTAVLGGHVMVGVNTMAGIAMAPTLRALATFDVERSEQFPDIPTVRELGYDVVQEAPYGLVGPAGMPRPVVQKLHDAFKKAMDSPDNHELLKQIYQIYWHRDPDDYAQWAKGAFAREGEMVRRTGLKPD